MRANLNRTGPRFRIPLPSSPSGLALGGGPRSRREVGGRDRGCPGPRAPLWDSLRALCLSLGLAGGRPCRGRRKKTKEEKKKNKPFRKKKTNLSGIITNRG